MIEDVRDITSFRWATVLANNPLSIKLDGDTAALALVPDSLVDPLTLAVNARVRVELSLRKVVVHGASNGSNVAAAVAAAMPAGTIVATGRATAAPGYVLCDGTSYTTAAQPSLFAAIGYTFGGSGANFNVPNLKGRVIVGIDAAQTEFDTRGETGGAKTHTHTLTQAIVALWQGYWKNRAGSSWTATNSNNFSIPGASGTVQNQGPAVEGSTDAGSSLQPYMALNYMIKL